MKTIDVAALGEILIDFTYADKNEQGAALFAQNPGGAPANVCVQVSRLNGKSAFAGKVGTDMHGDLLRETLKNEGISTKNMISDPDTFTTLAFVSVTPEGERKFSFARKPGADTRITFEELDKDEIKATKIFHIGSLSLTHEPARECTHKAIDLAKENGALISYDPNYRDSLWPNEEIAVEQMRTLISKADLMKISDEETALLTDLPDPEAAAKALVAQGVKMAVVTLGKDGALAVNANGTARAHGYSLKVADTNGAGDSFWGAMLTQVSRLNKPLDDLSVEEMSAMLLNANACAALTVTKHGAIPAMPSSDQVNAFLVEQNEREAF